MDIVNLTNLEINKMSKAQYDREKAAGNLNENALYLTEATEFVTQEQMEEYVALNGGKIDSISFNDVPQTIDSSKNVNIQAEIPEIKTFSNVSVSASAFLSDTEISQCPYKATITLNGVTAEYSPLVVFNPDIQFSGIQWVVDCGQNTLILYASQIPSADFVIASIICTKIS